MTVTEAGVVPVLSGMRVAVTCTCSSREDGWAACGAPSARRSPGPSGPSNRQEAAKSLAGLRGYRLEARAVPPCRARPGGQKCRVRFSAMRIDVSESCHRLAGEGPGFIDPDRLVIRSADADSQVGIPLQDIQGPDDNVARPEGLVADARDGQRMARLLLAGLAGGLMRILVENLHPVIPRVRARRPAGVLAGDLEADRPGERG